MPNISLRANLWLLARQLLFASISEYLKSDEAGIIADHHHQVSIVFADIAGFTAMSSETSSGVLVKLLNDLDESVFVVETSEYPAMVDLLELNDCIASLTAPTWLITAAPTLVKKRLRRKD